MEQIKSIEEWQKKSAGEWIRLYFTSPWYFEKVYEKLIMVTLCFLGLWKIFGWVYG